MGMEKAPINQSPFPFGLESCLPFAGKNKTKNTRRTRTSNSIAMGNGKTPEVFLPLLLRLAVPGAAGFAAALRLAAALGPRHGGAIRAAGGSCAGVAPGRRQLGAPKMAGREPLIHLGRFGPGPKLGSLVFELGWFPGLLALVFRNRAAGFV